MIFFSRVANEQPKKEAKWRQLIVDVNLELKNTNGMNLLWKGKSIQKTDTDLAIDSLNQFWCFNELKIEKINQRFSKKGFFSTKVAPKLFNLNSFQPLFSTRAQWIELFFNLWTSFRTYFSKKRTRKAMMMAMKDEAENPGMLTVMMIMKVSISFWKCSQTLKTLP